MLVPSLAFAVALVQSPSIDSVLAAQYFRQAEALSKQDGSRLWNKALYGPMLFADRNTRAVVANMPDAEGKLVKQGDVYTGVLPENVNIANTSLDYAGRRWTMVMWPLPELKYTRGRLMMHECFHRLQPELGLVPKDLPNSHLDDVNGRTWMRIEMRALSEALTQTGREREQAMRDALTFRAYRRSLCGAESKAAENALEMNEGLCEYTGWRLSGLPEEAQRQRAALRLDNEQSTTNFARSFAYATGPAYGLLLDLKSPGWNRKMRPDGSLDEKYVRLHGIQLPMDVERAAMEAAPKYGGDLMLRQEKEKEEARLARIADYKARFVDGPVVIMRPFSQFSFTFDPGAVDSLPGYGQLFPSPKVSDEWGILEVSSGHALFLRNDAGFTEVRVPAGSENPPLKGDGWALRLNPGWVLKAGDRKGDWVVAKA